MKTRILVLAASHVLAVFAVASAGGQAQWTERAIQGGVEFRLLNDEGTAIVLRCADQEVHAGFAFTEPMEAARGALVIGRGTHVEPGRFLAPSMRRSFPVAQVDDRTVQVASGPGLAFTLAMLRAGATIHVRTAGRRASFEVAGSDSMLAHCPGADERSRTGKGISAFGSLAGTIHGPTAQAATAAFGIAAGAADR